MSVFAAQFEQGGKQQDGGISLLIGGFITPTTVLRNLPARIIEANNPGERVFAINFADAAANPKALKDFVVKNKVKTVRTHSGGAMVCAWMIDFEDPEGWRPKQLTMFSPPQVVSEEQAKSAAKAEILKTAGRCLFGPDRINNSQLFWATAGEVVFNRDAHMRHKSDIVNFSGSDFAGRCASAGILTEVIDAQNDCFGFKNTTPTMPGLTHRIVEGANHNTFLTNTSFMLGVATAKQAVFLPSNPQIDLAQ